MPASTGPLSATSVGQQHEVAVDPLHPDWLYVFDLHGLMRSQDEGDTWTTLMDEQVAGRP